jgi:hypothetical protein
MRNRVMQIPSIATATIKNTGTCRPGDVVQRPGDKITGGLLIVLEGKPRHEWGVSGISRRDQLLAVGVVVGVCHSTSSLYLVPSAESLGHVLWKAPNDLRFSRHSAPPVIQLFSQKRAGTIAAILARSGRMETLGGWQWSVWGMVSAQVHVPDSGVGNPRHFID